MRSNPLPLSHQLKLMVLNGHPRSQHHSQNRPLRVLKTLLRKNAPAEAGGAKRVPPAPSAILLIWGWVAKAILSAFIAASRMQTANIALQTHRWNKLGKR